MAWNQNSHVAACGGMEFIVRRHFRYAFRFTCLVAGFAASPLVAGSGVDPITVLAVGDVTLGSAWPSVAELPPDQGRGLLDAIAPLAKASDVSIANIEGVIGTGLSPRQPIGPHSYRFLMAPWASDRIREAGFNVGSMANNHAMDGGPRGVASTAHHLAASGLAACGTPASPVATVTRRNGSSVAVISFAPHMGTLGFDVKTMVGYVQAAKAKNQVPIVVMHAGAEGDSARRTPRGAEFFLGANRGDVRAFAHAAIDAGASLVIGHGPHVLRGMEIYRGKLVAYSLGNFCTYGRISRVGRKGFAAALQVRLAPDGRFLGGKIVPTIQNRDEHGRLATILDGQANALKELIELSRQDFLGCAAAIQADGTIMVGDAR